MTSEHLFNERIAQQNFPQEKNQKADQSGRHVFIECAGSAAALSALGAQAGGRTLDTLKQEANSRG